MQNWFKAPGHRKKATLHSRHVPETSSRGSTIAIQQRRLQTPKWVCSVLQCPTWQSATYSTSLAPNMPSPPPAATYLFSRPVHPFSFSGSLCRSVSRVHLQSYLFLTFTVHHDRLLRSDWGLSFFIARSRHIDQKLLQGWQMCSFGSKMFNFHNAAQLWRQVWNMLEKKLFRLLFTLLLKASLFF